ncbi:MAG: apolipoprotein N-acyltransferase [Acidobacteriota bacterium]|nr:apolipoprotein N-acyltransferase [Acidobacteriota bacterium]
MTRPNLLSFTPDSLLRHSAMATLTAVLLLLSFPNFELDYLAWIALAPLLFVLAQGVSLRRAAALGWLTGVLFTFFAENWIAHSMVYFGGVATFIAYAVAFLFASVLALFPAMFAVVIAFLVKRFGAYGWAAVAFAPVVWVATEWLRPFITGVTWNALGVTQVNHFLIARLAQYGGAYLLSAEIVSVSALLVLLLKFKAPGVGRAAATLTVFAGVTMALPMLNQQPAVQNFASVSIVGVQPNLPPDADQSPDASTRDLENNIRLTKEAIERTPDKVADIVVWAESPLALFYENDSAVRERLDELAAETGSHFIINTVTRDDWRYHNSIHVIRPDNPTGNQSVVMPNLPPAKPMKRYDKIRLVPFGEYVPFKSLLGRVVETFATSGVGGFTPGTEPVVNTLRLATEREGIISGDDSVPTAAIERTTNFARVGAFICYEAAYPDLVRGFVKNGATLLVNVSNDAWFGNTAGARQHLAHARMRAIENDRDLVRVTNSGISALIRANGQVVDPLPSFQAGTQTWRAQLRRNPTTYSQRGDWFAIGCAVITLLTIAAALFFKRNNQPSTKTK